MSYANSRDADERSIASLKQPKAEQEN